MNTKQLRKKVRWRTYTLTLILCLGISTIMYYSKSSEYEYELRARQQSAVAALSEHVDSIGTELNKGMYASSSPMISEVSTKIARDCSCAKTALSQISASDTFLENTYKFLSQVGDFTASLNYKLQNGTQISDREREQLYELLKYSRKLSDSIISLIDEYESGSDFAVQTEGINTALSDIEQSFSDYPSLIYDGPFSDHINTEDAEMLTALPEIDEKEARSIAAKFTGIDENSLITGSVENGSFECYTFSTDSTGVWITKSGGLLCTLISSNRVGEETLSDKEAVKIGLDYLGSIGYTDMTETYYSTDDGICTVNYALKIGDIVCYTDLIKVSIALDNGRILAVDARGYIMNHQTRSLPEPALSKAEAQSRISSNLTVKSVKRALIPTEADKEYLCYEFLCTGSGGDDILVYIDGTTGVERDILLLLYSDGGTLTK